MAKGHNLRTEDIQAYPDFVQAVVLASSAAQAFDTPAGMGYVAMSFDVDIWVAYGSTGALYPSTTTTAGTTSAERIPGTQASPTMRNIQSTARCTGLSLISTAIAHGSLSWYKPG